MEIKNKCELLLKSHEKCVLICDSDCPLGQLYDYSCALQSFILSKMSDAEEAKKAMQKDAPEECKQSE